MLANRIRPGRQAGTSMIEVLISIVIVVLGLLGLAGLQSRAQLAEAESFQRAQAVILLQDMVERIQANKKAASTAYDTAGVPLGTGAGAEKDWSALTGADLDKCEWHNSLLGAAESAGGLKVGAMIGARGCVDVVRAAMPREFLVSVAWQGLSSTVNPGASDCGAGQYAPAETRRLVTASVVIGCLQNNSATGACITTVAP